MRFPKPEAVHRGLARGARIVEAAVRLKVDVRVLAERRQAELGAEPSEVEGHHAQRQVDELAVEIDGAARGGVGARDGDRQTAGLHPVGRQLRAATHANFARQAGSAGAPELEIDLLETRRLLAELGVRLDLPSSRPPPSGRSSRGK